MRTRSSASSDNPLPLEGLVAKDYLKGELEKLEGRLKLFVTYTVLGSAAAIVLAQVIMKFLDLAP